MAAGLVVPVSGPYLASWGGLPLGTQNDEGYVLTCTIGGQSVDSTDQVGKTLVEGVYQGQNWRARMRGLEWTIGLKAALQAFGTVQGDQDDALNPTLSGTAQGLPAGSFINVGDLFTSYARPLVLTAILGNPPTTPQSLTATNAIVPPDFQTEFMMTSQVRELPLELALIPYLTTVDSVTIAVPFTTI